MEQTLTGNSPSPEDNQRIPVLITTYQIERYDQANSGTLIVALVSIGLVYIAGTLAFLVGSRAARIPPELVLAIPLPLVMVTGLLIFHVAASDLRNRYMLHLGYLLSHKEISAPYTYPRSVALSHGLFATGGMRNLIHILLSILTSSAPFLITVAFTSDVLLHTSRNLHPQRGWLIGFAIAYAVLFLLEGSVAFSILLFTKRRQARFNEWADKLLREHRHDWRRSSI